MNQIDTSHESDVTIRQTTSFDLGVGRAKLIKSIENHKKSILSIEETTGSSRRVQFLREEIVRLEKELAEQVF